MFSRRRPIVGVRPGSSPGSKSSAGHLAPTPEHADSISQRTQTVHKPAGPSPDARKQSHCRVQTAPLRKPGGSRFEPLAELGPKTSAKAAEEGPSKNSLRARLRRATRTGSSEYFCHNRAMHVSETEVAPHVTVRE